MRVLLASVFSQMLLCCLFSHRQGRQRVSPARSGARFREMIKVLFEAAIFFNLTEVDLSLFSNPTVLHFCGSFSSTPLHR
jgi:hypothetical protein